VIDFQVLQCYIRSAVAKEGCDLPEFAKTPSPPYYAVIFSSLRTAMDNGYDTMAGRMLALAAEQPGFLGAESTRDAAGFGITVSYWQTQEDIVAWKNHVEHIAAQVLGQSVWYEHYELRVARVERAYARTES
jgi:heme-degrading monooxygenase HmoA